MTISGSDHFRLGHFGFNSLPITSGSHHFRFRSIPVVITSGCDNFRFRSFPVPITSGSDQFWFRSLPVPIISGYSHFRFRSFLWLQSIPVPTISGSDQFRFRSLPVPIASVPIISGYVHFAPLDYGDCDLCIHLSVNLELLNTADKSSLNISKLHKKNAVITLCVITLCEVIITLCAKCVTLCGYKMYYIMRKSYYIMRKLLRYAASQPPSCRRICRMRVRTCACQSVIDVSELWA